MDGNAIRKEETLSDHVLSLNGHMEELAAAGEWQKVMEFMVKRDAMIREIDENDRKAVLLAARRSTDQIRKMAESAKRETADRLAALKRGQKAADSYRTHG